MDDDEDDDDDVDDDEAEAMAGSDSAAFARRLSPMEPLFPSIGMRTREVVALFPDPLSFTALRPLRLKVK